MAKVGWVVKVGKVTKHGAVESIKWRPHSGVLGVRQAAQDYLDLLRKLEPQHDRVEIFPVLPSDH